MPLKESQIRAVKKYQDKHYFKGTFSFPKALESIIREKAEFYGSVNAYLTFLVKSDISDTLMDDITNVPFEDAP